MHNKSPLKIEGIHHLEGIVSGKFIEKWESSILRCRQCNTFLSIYDFGDYGCCRKCHKIEYWFFWEERCERLDRESEQQESEWIKRNIAEAEEMSKVDKKYPKSQRALSFYYYEPTKMRQYATTRELIDMFLKELDIEIPEEDKDDKDKTFVYFAMAEKILPERDSKFEEWTKSYA